MSNSNIGYQEDPENSEGIIRARTTKQIRSWEIPRTMKALEVLNIELGRIEFPGIYILFEGKKPKGWQITFRWRKPGSFIDSLQKGEGYLLVSRNGVLLIPLTEVQKVILDKTAYEQDTIDIWIVFAEEKVTLSYKRNTIDVTKFRLIN